MLKQCSREMYKQFFFREFAPSDLTQFDRRST